MVLSSKGLSHDQSANLDRDGQRQDAFGSYQLRFGRLWSGRALRARCADEQAPLASLNGRALRYPISPRAPHERPLTDPRRCATHAAKPRAHGSCQLNVVDCSLCHQETRASLQRLETRYSRLPQEKSVSVSQVGLKLLLGRGEVPACSLHP